MFDSSPRDGGSQQPVDEHGKSPHFACNAQVLGWNIFQELELPIIEGIDPNGWIFRVNDISTLTDPRQ